MTDKVQVEIKGDVATIMLNKPERLNALDNEMWHGIGEACRVVDAAPDVRVAVLMGAGGSIPICRFFKDILGMESILVGFGLDFFRLKAVTEIRWAVSNFIFCATEPIEAPIRRESPDTMSATGRHMSGIRHRVGDRLCPIVNI